MKLFYGLCAIISVLFGLLAVYLFVTNVEENRGNLRPKKEDELKPLLGVVYGRQ